VKERVAFVLYTDKQYRTFIESEFLSEVRNLVEVDLIVYSSSKILNKFPSSRTVFIPPLGRFLDRSGTLLATAKLWHNKHRSRAHFFRAVASFGNRKARKSNKTMILYNMDGWTETKRRLIRLIGASSIFIYFISKLRRLAVRLAFYRKMKENRNVFLDYRFVIVPFSGLLSSEFDDLINVFNTLSITTVAIQENWDNLSSKTFIDSKPKYFLVWGEQSAGHVHGIHNLDDTKTFVIGSPRFLPYFQYADSSLNNVRSLDSLIKTGLDIKSPYVLFTGTGDGIDDEFILRETLETLQKDQSCSHLSLVYRPHPFTRNPISSDVRREIQSKRVVIDNADRSRAVFHHCPLIANAELVVNQFSTMLLESLACNVKVLLPTFVSRPVNYDYSQAINEWHHFMGLNLLSNVFVSKNQLAYSADLKAALTSEKSQSSSSIHWMVDLRPSKTRICDFTRMLLTHA
jgi:hypothetical protein